MKSSAPSYTFIVLAVLLLFPTTGVAAEVPEGFSVTQVATGMTSVTRMELLPDGRILVLEQAGNIRVIENGVLRPTPFLTVDADAFSEHGLLGIALDPAFATNHFFYVYYTAKVPALHNRVSRFTVNGDSADPASEVILFELDDLQGALGWHQGGNLRFGPDGKLYIAVGDDRNGANSQSMGNLFGKVLRINNDGSIPTDNPFYASATGKNRAIWTLGLRNPFSFAFGSGGGGNMFINDVGEDTWEEIDRGVAGGNYGWPETEGPTSDPRFQSPILVYGHGDNLDTGCAITGAAFYEPLASQFPAKYRGTYFYADFCNGWIRSLNTANLTAELFAFYTYYPVDIKVANDGALYYLERGLDSNTDGAVFKIEYTNNQAPQITTQPADVVVAQGQSASFMVSASGADPLSYQWQRNGVDLPGENSPTLTIPSPALSDNGAAFVCVVSNDFGSVSSQPAFLTVIAGSAPVATVTSPADGTQYHGGDVIQYSGTGFDADDGDLPASAFTWQIDFHHNTHTHPFIPAFSGVTFGQFTIPSAGETATDVWYRIHLTVRDSSGLTHTTYRDVTPVIETITLATNPPGLKVKLDEQPQNTPEDVPTVVGVARTLSAVSPQDFDGQTYVFDSWSDGGAATHTIDHGGTYVANYRLASPTQSTDVVLYASEGVTIGSYVIVPDATAAGGARVHNPDGGAAKLTSALANPGSYLELHFTAQAGVAYRLWIRGKAQDDSPYNDSIFVQFDDSVDEQGAAKSRIGSTSAEVINLEDCFACGLSNWGWQDDGWGVGVLGPLIYFANTGTHTLRIQVREDGLSIDQVVLSPQTYLNTAPGAVINDNTILPKSGSP
jgi:glucose/arabinose dehydrogenase